MPIIGVLENKNKCWAELAASAKSLGLQTKTFKCSKPFDPRTVYQIRKYMTQNRVDIIHAHGYKANFYALMSTIFCKVPCMATCHPWLETGDSLRATFYTFLDRLLLGRFKKIVAISEELKKEILQEGRSKLKITVIENGIDISRFSNNYNTEQVRRELGIADNFRIIGTIGRLSPEKAHLDLLEAAKMLKESFANVFVLIVGDGPMRANLEAAIEKLGLNNNVLITGVRNDIPDILAIFDIFVLPSHSEGLPIALLEAMAAKKPIIATNVGSIPNVLSQKKSGILIPPRDVYLLKNAMAELLGNSSKADLFAQNAYTTVEAQYSSKRMTEEYMDIYEQFNPIKSRNVSI